MRFIMKTRPTLWFAASARIAILAIAAVPTLVRAQSADPNKPADVKGVPDVAPADVATAIKYCKVAAGSSRRALYQLGRAYAANKQMPEAIGSLRKAARKGPASP